MAKLTAEQRNALPNSSFAVVEDCYKDGSPKAARHLPIHDAPHVRNAAARVNQIQPVCPGSNKEELIRKAMRRINAAKKKFGIGETNVKGHELAIMAVEFRGMKEVCAHKFLRDQGLSHQLDKVRGALLSPQRSPDLFADEVPGIKGARWVRLPVKKGISFIVGKLKPVDEFPDVVGVAGNMLEFSPFPEIENAPAYREVPRGKVQPIIMMVAGPAKTVDESEIEITPEALEAAVKNNVFNTDLSYGDEEHKGIETRVGNILATEFIPNHKCPDGKERAAIKAYLDVTNPSSVQKLEAKHWKGVSPNYLVKPKRTEDGRLVSDYLKAPPKGNVVAFTDFPQFSSETGVGFAK